MSACPCSDHVFALARMGKFIAVEDALEYIKKLGRGVSMRCLTKQQCDTIMHATTWGKVDILKIFNNSTLMQRHVIVNAASDPMFVLATYSPALPGRSILCTTTHKTPSCLSTLIWDFRHLEIVRLTYAETIADSQYISLPDAKTSLLAKSAIARVIMDNFDANFDAQIELKPMQQYVVIRACSRAMQDLLMYARFGRSSMFTWVPKDVIKIIHRMIFDGYMELCVANDNEYDWDAAYPHIGGPV